jgi:glycosyltransferase involved in cell wall biosynthesis
MSKTVLFRAPVLSKSGYGVHARQIAKWLFAKEEELDLDITVEALNWGGTGWITDVEAEDGLVGRVLQATNDPKSFYDVTIQLQLPNEWNPMLGGYNIGITAGVETDLCYPAWVDAVNNMNLVIVPSEFTKETFMRSGPVSTPIVVIPESFIDEVATGEGKIDLDVPTEFNFLVFGQVTGSSPENDRKNIPYTLKWLAETFANRPDVGVILKTNMMRNTKLDRHASIGIFTQLLMSIVKGSGPRFYLLHGDVSNEEVAGLYTHPKVKALLTLTHGEGFGLPILEAAASGLPVIAPAWSGHMEFMKHGRFIQVAHELKQIDQTRVDNNIFCKEAKWACPIEADVKQRLAKFVESPDVPKKWAMELREKLLPMYNFEAISALYDKTLLDVLKE